jgi:DNA-binding beta-propeller fold protein YncE
MNRTALAVTVISCLAVAACEETPPPQAPPPAPAAPEPPPVAAPAPPPPAPEPPPPAAPPPPAYTVRPLSLPGATADGVGMDYLALDRASGRVWVPAGNTGSVDVIEPGGDKIIRVEGFPTKEVERNGKKRIVGPSSASVGDGFVYVGNRADANVCALDMKAPARGKCIKLASPPDGIAFVAATKEVWVTTPRDKSITILDASKPGAPRAKGKLALPGEPEGYAVDSGRGVFYTNLEDGDRTLAIDVRARKVVSTWLPACGEGGPKGLALDLASSLLVVACTDHVEVLDAGHDGKVLGKLDTGAGVDNLDYVEARHELFAAAGKAGQLTIARLDASGALSSIAVVPTAQGARNAVADANGTAYLTDSAGGHILMVTKAP